MHPDSDPALQSLLAHYLSMPPVAAMRLRIAGADGDSLRLCAPLAAHVNDKGLRVRRQPGFADDAGRLGRITLALERAGLRADVFVAASEVRYRAPLFADLEAVARADAAELAAFVAALRRRRANLNLDARVPLPKAAAPATCVRATSRSRNGVGWPRPKRRKGRCANRLRWWLAALLGALLAACASGQPKMSELDKVRYAWSAAIRWGDFEGAWNLLDPAYRDAHPLTDLELSRYKADPGVGLPRAGFADPRGPRPARDRDRRDQPQHHGRAHAALHRGMEVRSGEQDLVGDLGPAGISGPGNETAPADRFGRCGTMRARFSPPDAFP